MSYNLVRVDLPKQTAYGLFDAMVNKRSFNLKLGKDHLKGSEYPLMLTNAQLNKFNKHKDMNKGLLLKLSKKQLGETLRNSRNIDQQGSGWIKDIFSTVGKVVGSVVNTLAPGSADAIESVGDKIGETIEGSVIKNKKRKIAKPIIKELSRNQSKILNSKLSMHDKAKALREAEADAMDELKEKTKNVGAGNNNNYNLQALPYGVGMDDICPHCGGSGFLTDLFRPLLNRRPMPKRMIKRMPKRLNY
jgi:coenzyme F420-reducing hydrogenase delta subunit